MRRFLAKCEPVTESGCWIWTAATTGNGYGVFYLGGKLLTAHRASYILYRGSVPDGLDVDHLCRNRLCVNPNHLEIVTRSINLKRGLEARGCKNGHPFSIETFSEVRRSDGRIERRCILCHRIRNRRAKRRMRSDWKLL